MPPQMPYQKDLVNFGCDCLKAWVELKGNDGDLKLEQFLGCKLCHVAHRNRAKLIVVN